MSKEAMKRFLIETSVENAEGSQTWYVDAASEAEALKQYEQGGCDLYASNVDVTSLGEPEIAGETTLNDFGDFAEQPAQQPDQISELHGALEDLVEAVCAVPDASWPDGFRWVSVRHAKDALARKPAPQPAQQEPVAITTGMALAFHRALTDGPINDAEAKEIKIGLEAAFAHLITPQAQPAQQEPVAMLFGSLPVYDKPAQQEPVAHCEAGPEHCPVCLAETRSLALAAAVGYIQRNTPKLVSEEICRALGKISPPASKPLTEHQTMSMTFNHHWLTSMTLRDAYRLGIRDAEAAHGIKENT